MIAKREDITNYRILLRCETEDEYRQMIDAVNLLIDRQSLLTLDKIVNAVCDYYSITTDQLFTKSRERNFVYRRHILFYFVYRNKGNYCLQDLERLYPGNAGLDHSTIIHGYKSVINLIPQDPFIQKSVAEITTLIPTL